MPTPERLSSVLWQRTDRIYLEHGTLDRIEDGHILAGVVLYRGRSGPSRFGYTIQTDESWHSRSVRLDLDEPTGTQTVELAADAAGSWTRDGVPMELPFPCQDIDLAISPSTNTLAIRRLALAVGETGHAHVLWIQVPSFGMRAVEQAYERIDKTTYRYKGKFGSYKIEVDDNGLVLQYPGGGWHAGAHRARRAAASRGTVSRP
jgi:hypothetical protein